MSESRQYELVYIASPDATEQQLAELQTLVEQTVGRFNGRLDTTENWGRRRLAYEIQRHKEGTYVLHVITGPGDMVKELDRKLKVVDTVMRHLVVRVDEEQRVAERRRAERQEQVRQRRIARGLPPEPTPEETRAIGRDQDDRRGDEHAEEAEV
jgi:small subunit ribosomal protein S6